MAQTELQELKDYWTTKYPHISITLYERSGGGYHGKMMTHNTNFDFQADTIGELISHGESFLRTHKQ